MLNIEVIKIINLIERLYFLQSILISTVCLESIFNFMSKNIYFSDDSETEGIK